MVLAAGEGRRMGGPKALLPLAGGTFLSHACAAVDRPGVARVVAVLGASADRVRAETGLPAPVRIALNPRWPEGMLTSVWAGLDAAGLQRQVERIWPTQPAILAAAGGRPGAA